MDKKLLEILDSYGLEIITNPDAPRFIKGTGYNSKRLISEIITNPKTDLLNKKRNADKKNYRYTGNSKVNHKISGNNYKKINAKFET